MSRKSSATTQGLTLFSYTVTASLTTGNFAGKLCYLVEYMHLVASLCLSGGKKQSESILKLTSLTSSARETTYRALGHMYLLWYVQDRRTLRD